MAKTRSYIEVCDQEEGVIKSPCMIARGLSSVAVYSSANPDLKGKAGPLGLRMLARSIGFRSTLANTWSTYRQTDKQTGGERERQ